MENIETIEDFIALYFQMRDMQKKYFQLRFMADLNRARILEKELDKKCMEYIKRKTTINKNQGELFN